MLIFNEPTYSLKLTSQNGPLAARQDGAPYPSLDALVDKVVHERFKDQTVTAKTRKQVAHSLVNRPDQRSTLKINLELAKKQGLLEAITKRLGGNKELAEFVFSGCSEENFGFILYTKVRGNSKLFNEVCKIREELDELTSGVSKYYRPKQATDGLSYIDHHGKTVVLSQTIPSSADRTHPDVQNGRMNLDGKGHVVYSTGRIETERKAHEVLYRMISQTLSSGQIELENLIQQDGSYLYPVMIENLIGAASFSTKEKKYLLQENEVLKSFAKTPMTVTLSNGRVVSLKLQLMQFSTQTNYDSFLGQSHRLACTGSDIAEQITDEGLESLENYYSQCKETLSPSKRQATETCLNALKSCSNFRDRLVLRAFICEILNIPYHVHCKSSKDRTATVAAIKKGVHLFHNIETWKGSAKFRDPRGLFNNPVFREYTEAALFESLPLTDQGVGFSGALDGNLYTQNRGFNFSRSVLEHPLPASVLTDRHIYKASIIERIGKTILLGAASLVLTPLYVSLSPLVLGILYLKYKEDYLKAYSHIFLSIFFLPAFSYSRQNWIDRDDKVLKERNFILHHKEVKTDPALQKLYDQVDNLKSYNNLLKFIQNGQTEMTDEDKAVLTTLADNWTTLQKVTSPPRRIQKLLKTSETSPLLLFHLLRHFNQSFVEKAVHENKNLFLWPAENSYHALVKSPSKEKLTNNLALDIGRQQYVIQGKYRSHSFMNLHPSKWDEMQKVLREFSLFRDDATIPSQVQESLTQNIFAPLEMIFTSICGDVCYKNVEKAIVIEEGDASHFWITIRNKATIRALLEDDSVSFDFDYRLKISKSATSEWSTQFVSITPFQTKVDGALKGLLETIEVSDVLEEASRVAREGVNDIVRSAGQSLQEEETYASSHLRELIKQHETNVARTIDAATRI